MGLLENVGAYQYTVLRGLEHVKRIKQSEKIRIISWKYGYYYTFHLKAEKDTLKQYKELEVLSVQKGCLSGTMK